MNIFSFEIKSQLRSFIIWTVSAVAAVLVLILAFFPAFSESGDTVMHILEGFPKEFSEALGLTFITMFSYEGFFSFTFTYFALFGGIWALSTSMSIFGKEKRAKCSDFLLSKPKSRSQVFGEKLLAVLILIIVSNIIYLIVSMILYQGYSGTDSGTFFLASCCLLFVQIFFAAIGIAVSTFTKKIRSVSAAASSIGFGCFILFAISNIIEERAFDFFVPLKYFDPSKLIIGEGMDMPLVITGVCVAIVAFIGSYIYYLKSDVHSV